MKNDYFFYNEIKKTDIVDYLASVGYRPAKIRGNDYWYHSPYRNEHTPSFKVDRKLNVWYDHGVGEGGTILDLGSKLHQCTINEFLEKLTNGNHAIPTFPHLRQAAQKPQSTLKILTVRNLNNPGLLDYLRSRDIDADTATNYCKEVEFQIGKRTYVAIGFVNRLGGYELRNSWFKGSSSPKDISFIGGDTSRLCVLEGFTDFLSLRKLDEEQIRRLTDNASFLVLNSLSFLTRNLSLLQSYPEVNLFLDNDLAGKAAVENLKKMGIPFKDASFFYKSCKDINEYLSTVQSERRKSSMKMRPFR